MLTSVAPYQNIESKKDVWIHVLKTGTPEMVTGDVMARFPDLQDFLLQCLQADPQSRGTALSLLKHKFLTRATANCQEEISHIIPRLQKNHWARKLQLKHAKVES